MEKNVDKVQLELVKSDIKELSIVDGLKIEMFGSKSYVTFSSK